MRTLIPPVKTEIGERGTLRLSSALRDRLNVEAGDMLRWTVSEDGNIEIEVVDERYGAFDDDFEKAPMGGDGSETHDLAGYEDDPVFSEER